MLLKHTLISIVGFSSWILVNAVWVELGLLVSVAPEGYALASWMAAALQCANIFPLLYSLAALKKDPPVPYSISISVIILMGILASELLSVYWRESLPIMGQQRSLPLLLLLFFGGALDCTSSVVYWPYISKFEDSYSAALATGESLSGSIPAFIAIAQIPLGDTPRFQPETFFHLISGILFLCLIAFAVLQCCPPSPVSLWNPRSNAQKQSDGETLSDRLLYISQTDDGSERLLDPGAFADDATLSCHAAACRINTATTDAYHPASQNSTADKLHPALHSNTADQNHPASHDGSPAQLWALSSTPVTMEACLKFCIDGIGPSLLPFAAGHFSAPVLTMTWVAVACNIAAPLGSHVATYRRARVGRLAPLALAWGAPWALVVSVAAAGVPSAVRPHGWALAVVAAAASGAAAYTHAMVFVELGRRGSAAGVDAAARTRSFRWAGIATQTGSFAGTAAAFVLINWAGLFATVTPPSGGD